MSLERYGLMLSCGCLLSLAALRCSGITGNLTDSEPRGLYLRRPQQPRRGSMVELRPLIKHLAGVPGDTVRVSPEGSYINGKLWPNSAIPKHTYGYTPYPFGTIRLQANQYWILGSSNDSWDSRWLGPISGDLIASTITPLWTR